MTDKVPISWEDLLNAYQGPVHDPSAQPLLNTNSGEITCSLLLDPSDIESKIESGLLVPLPVKDGVRGYEQRTEFAKSLCDQELEFRLIKALKTEQRFYNFDSILAEVPVEALRWQEEERRTDIQTLCTWLTRIGVEPDPVPHLKRTIIEFPIKKPLPNRDE